MRLLVTGGRYYWDAEAVNLELAAMLPRVIIQGGANGADTLARQWALRNGVEMIERPAQWRDRDGVYNPRAGFERNQMMLVIDRPTLVLAFPGGTGTADMVRRARRMGVPVREAGAPGLWDLLLG